MNKMAIFVEGQTEQLFVEKLVTEVAGANCVQIERASVVGRLRSIALKAPAPAPAPDRYVLIVNSGSDNSVASDVKENYEKMTTSGYSSIIGIRDVYPKSMSDIPSLRKWMGYGVKTKPVKVSFVLAVMEIEAWFLTEHTHFPKLHADLTMDRIKAAMGFDPSVDDMTQRAHPAEDLHAAYATVGLAYTKRRSNALRTINAMDYATIYVELTTRVSAIGELVGSIEKFLAPVTAAP